MLLPETTIDGAEAFPDHFRIRIEEMTIIHGEATLQVTTSIDISQYHGKMTGYKELIQEVDKPFIKPTRKAATACFPLSKPSSPPAYSGSGI